MKAGALTYHRAESLEQAVELNGRFDSMAKFLAGGQSLMPMMNLRLVLSEHIIDISAIAALRESKSIADRFFVGAGVTHAMIEDGRIDDPTRGYLRHVAAGISYRSVRNKGTLGGSLVHADPAADWPTALAALDAVTVIHGADAERNVELGAFQVGLMETCLAESELLKGVLLPRLSERARWSYLKFCHKVGEFGHSIAAVVHDPSLSLANVVMGAAFDRPVRLPAVSELIAKGLKVEDVESGDFATLLQQDLTEQANLQPGSYEFQLHRTVVKRSVTAALNK